MHTVKQHACSVYTNEPIIMHTFSDNWAFDSHLVAVLQFHICKIFMETCRAAYFSTIDSCWRVKWNEQTKIVCVQKWTVKMLTHMVLHNVWKQPWNVMLFTHRLIWAWKQTSEVKYIKVHLWPSVQRACNLHTVLLNNFYNFSYAHELLFFQCCQKI